MQIRRLFYVGFLQYPFQQVELLQLASLNWVRPLGAWARTCSASTSCRTSAWFEIRIGWNDLETNLVVQGKCLSEKCFIVIAELWPAWRLKSLLRLCKNTGFSLPGLDANFVTHFYSGPFGTGWLSNYLDVILSKLLPMFKYSMYGWALK